MDNLYEVLILEEETRFDKEKPNKAENTPKKEKLCSELPIFSSGLKKISPEALRYSTDKQRHRIYTQSRTDLCVSDAKSQKRPEKDNFSKVPFLPLLSIRTTAIEELYKEIKDLRNIVAESEERNKVNSQCIEIGRFKLQELEERHSALKKRAGIGCSADERREELQGRLKGIHKEWVKNSIMLKAKILELEEEAKRVRGLSESLKEQVRRSDKNQRGAKKSLNNSGSVSDGGYKSCEHLNSSGKITKNSLLFVENSCTVEKLL